MYLAEVRVEMENIARKIKQLKSYIAKICGFDAESTDRAVNQLIELVDKYQSHRIAYSRYCNNIKLQIGETEVTLTEAKIILDTMKEKIDVLESLIDSEENTLDVFSLMGDRDKLYKDYASMSNGLKSIEWSTKID